MPTLSEITDESLLAILRRQGSVTVAELAKSMEVTATAVRQRLTRLMAQDLVERNVQREESPSRGRPTHQYSLTSKAKHLAGDNYADLATVLWDEIRSIKDADVRRGLLQRLSQAFAERYRQQIRGTTTAERMESLKQLFADRRIPLSVISGEAVNGKEANDKVASGGKPDNEIDDPDNTPENNRSAEALPILRVEDCPYPDLAEKDRGICAMEKMIFADLIDDDLRLTQCRLDGHSCCEFSAGS